MTRLADLLADNPILLLCVLLAVGSMIGALSFRRFSLGPAAVLFLALALSAYDERLKLPAIIGTLGLVLFAYTIGVSAGPSFFASLRTGGRAIVGVVVLLAAAAGLTVLVGHLVGLDGRGALRRVRRCAHQHPGAGREPRAAAVRAAHRRLLGDLPRRRARHAHRRRVRGEGHGARRA